MKSSSLKLAMRHGIKNPHEYRDKLIHQFILGLTEVARLEVYKLVVMRIDLVKERIANGEIMLGRKSYSVIWIHKPASIHADAMMSFRYCPLLHCGYVLIKQYEHFEDSEWNPQRANLADIRAPLAIEQLGILRKSAKPKTVN